MKGSSVCLLVCVSILNGSECKQKSAWSVRTSAGKYLNTPLRGCHGDNLTRQHRMCMCVCLVCRFCSPELRKPKSFESLSLLKVSIILKWNCQKASVPTSLPKERDDSWVCALVCRDWGPFKLNWYFLQSETVRTELKLQFFIFTADGTFPSNFHIRTYSHLSLNQFLRLFSFLDLVWKDMINRVEKL